QGFAGTVAKRWNEQRERDREERRAKNDRGDAIERHFGAIKRLMIALVVMQLIDDDQLQPARGLDSRQAAAIDERQALLADGALDLGECRKLVVDLGIVGRFVIR